MLPQRTFVFTQKVARTERKIRRAWRARYLPRPYAIFANEKRCDQKQTIGIVFGIAKNILALSGALVAIKVPS